MPAPPPAVSSGCSLPLTSTDLPSCPVKGRTRGRGTGLLPLGLWRCPVSSANTPLPLLGQTLQEEGLAAGPVLALRQHPRKAEPTGGENTGTGLQLGLGFPADTEPLLLRLCSYKALFCWQQRRKEMKPASM